MNIARSRAHEEHVETLLQHVFPNARRQPGSGNQATAPNDVVARGEYYIECKETSAASITMPHAWFVRLRKNSLVGGLRHILALRFSGRVPADLYVIDEPTLEHYLQCEREVNEKTARDE